MSVQNLGANCAGITTLINIGYRISGFFETKALLIIKNRNEPDFATPYLYNYINKQAKSVERSRGLADQ
jgi:putative alpha-1,2-mannosidase